MPVTRRHFILSTLSTVPMLAACTISGSKQQAQLEAIANATATPTAGTPTVAPTPTSNGTPQPATPTPLPTVAPTTTPGGNVALRLGVGAGAVDISVYKDIAAAYTTAHKQVTVTVETLASPATLMAAIGAGTAPDVVTLGWQDFASIGDQGLLNNLATLAAGSLLDTSGLFSVLTDFASQANGNLAVPLSFSPAVLFYNTAKFEAAGIAKPDVQFDWQHFEAAANALSTGGLNIGFATGVTPLEWFPWVWANGGQPFDDELTLGICQLDSPQATEGIQRFADLWLKQKGTAKPGDTTAGATPWDAFVAGNAGMVVGTRADTVRLHGSAFGWQVTYLPLGPGGHANPYTGTFGSVTRASRSPLDAAMLLGFLGTDAVSQKAIARTGTAVPALVAAASSSDFKLASASIDDAVFVNAELFAFQPPRTPIWQQIQDAWAPMLGPVWTGDKQATDVAKGLVNATNQLLVAQSGKASGQPFSIAPPPSPTPAPAPAPPAGTPTPVK